MQPSKAETLCRHSEKTGGATCSVDRKWYFCACIPSPFCVPPVRKKEGEGESNRALTKRRLLLRSRKEKNSTKRTAPTPAGSRKIENDNWLLRRPRPKQRLSMKNVIRLTCLAVSLLLCACQAKKEAQVVPVYTATTPLVEDIALPRSYVANIASLRNVEIRSQQAGVLQNVYASEGQYVKAGQPLFRIAIFGANEEVTKAKAAAEQARIDLQNVEKLAESKVVSNNAKRMAAAKLKGAEADYRLAVMRKRLSIIRAPFSGILGRIPNKQGSLIEENNLLTSLSDNTKVLVYFNISETDYLDFRLHPERYAQNPLQLVLANGEVFPAHGKILDLGGQFDSSTGTIAIRASFDNPHSLLRNGETGTVKLFVEKKQAMLIPQEAVYELQDQKYVFVVDRNNVVHQRAIKIDAEYTGTYVVSSGLQVTDRFLVDGIQKVNEGDKVRVSQVSPRAAMKLNKLNAD